MFADGIETLGQNLLNCTEIRHLYWPKCDVIELSHWDRTNIIYTQNNTANTHICFHSNSKSMYFPKPYGPYSTLYRLHILLLFDFPRTVFFLYVCTLWTDSCPIDTSNECIKDSPVVMYICLFPKFAGTTRCMTLWGESFHWQSVCLQAIFSV